MFKNDLKIERWLISKKVWLWIAGTLVVLIIAGYAGWQYLKKDMASPHSKIAKSLLTEQLKKMISEASDGLYHIGYDKFNLNIDSGECLVTNFRLIPDTAVYNKLAALHKAPNNILYVRTEALIIHGFGFSKTASGRHFNISAITLKHPVIRMVNKRFAYNDADNTGKTSLLLKMSKNLLRIIAVKNMNINNLFFTLVNRNEKQEKSTSFEHWNMVMNNFTAGTAGSNKTDSTKNKQLYFKTGFFPDSHA